MRNIRARLVVFAEPVQWIEMMSSDYLTVDWYEAYFNIMLT